MNKQHQEQPLIDDIQSLGDTFSALADEALAAYMPLVEDLLRNNSQNKEVAFRLLDGLFDFCFDDRVLQLYRKVCRHLYFLDPEAAVEYVNMYREYYEEEENHHENQSLP